MFLIFFKLFFTILSLFISGYILNVLLKIVENNYFYTVFKGIVFFGFISLFVNFFFPLNQFINSIIILLFFIIFLKLNLKINWKKLIQNLTIISIFSFILIIYSNGFEPDASLYHLPATFNINNEKIIIGLNNIHFRMGIISILQYINAFNLNLINGTDGIIFISAIAVSTLLTYLSYEFYEVIKKKKNFLSFFLLLLIAIICLRFNRYSDFGNDALGHVFFLLLIYSIIKSVLIKNENLEKNLNIFIVFLCLQKVFYFYLLIIPIFLNLNRLKFKKQLYFDFSHFFSFLFLCLWIIKNILVTGCALYPVSITCSKSLNWYISNSKTEPNAEIVALKGEAWAKNWNKNDTNLDMENYIKNFNWLNTWKSDHLKYIKNKLTPFFVFILIMMAFKLSIEKKNFFKIKHEKLKNIIYNKNYLVSLVICLVGFILWFWKFPIFRYGSSFILTFISLIFLPIISSFRFKKIYSVILFSTLLSIFLIKNSYRIYNDHDKKPIIHKIKSNKFEKISIEGLNFYRHDYGCGYSRKLCTNYSNILENLKAKKINNYIIIYPK